MTLHITVGIPGSGKSTWATRWFLVDVENRMRVNLDDLRAMLYPGNPSFSKQREPTVHLTMLRIIKDNIASKDIICDNTHLNWAKIIFLLAIAAKDNTPVCFHLFDDSFDLEECLKRNAIRSGRARVPEEVVKNMFKQYPITRKKILDAGLNAIHIPQGPQCQVLV